MQHEQEGEDRHFQEEKYIFLHSFIRLSFDVTLNFHLKCRPKSTHSLFCVIWNPFENTFIITFIYVNTRIFHKVNPLRGF